MPIGEIYNIIIIEDNPDMRMALQAYIEETDNLHVSGVYTNCEDALKEVKQLSPDVVLMDIDLPGISGVEGTKEIKSLCPKSEVIIITVFENSETVLAALQAGAAGYLTKTFSEEELIVAIHECINGGAPMSMKIARMVVSSFQKNTKTPLTKRETEVLSCLAKGKSYNSTAEELFISLDTVKYHIKNIYIKLQATSREEAIEIANQKKYI